MYTVVPFCGQNHCHKQESWKHVRNKYIASNSSCAFRLSTNLKKLWLKFSILMRITTRWLIKTDMLCVSIIQVAKQSNTRYTKATGLQIKTRRSSLFMDAVARFLKNILCSNCQNSTTSLNSVWTANVPSTKMRVPIIKIIA